MTGDNAVVIGASGLVGRALMRKLNSEQIPALGTYRTKPESQAVPLDITDPLGVREFLVRIRPSIIFMTAALTHVDYCEDHPDEAIQINVEGPRSIATAAGRLGARLVFYSTEYVFDGSAGPHSEEAQPSPLNVYGRTKLEAERVIATILPDCLILRTAVVYGWEPDSKNFAIQVYERARAGERMTIPFDQISNPTLAKYLAEVSVKLVQQGVSGVVNVVGKDWLPRSEFALALVKLFGGNPDLVIPVSTASLNQQASRPLRGGLRTEKLRELMGSEAMSLADALEKLKCQIPIS